MKILEYTFQHLTGFGESKERELWNKNIFTWDDFEKKSQQQLNFNFYESPSILSESKSRLKNKDVAYFTARLPNNLHFLIPHSFPEDTLFLDIETTGLSIYYDTITIVGWSRLDEYGIFIHGDHQSEQKLLQTLATAKCIITFNGSVFDLPFLRNFFEDVSVPFYKVLRWFVF